MQWKTPAVRTGQEGNDNRLKIKLIPGTHSCEDLTNDGMSDNCVHLNLEKVSSTQLIHPQTLADHEDPDIV